MSKARPPFFPERAEPGHNTLMQTEATQTVTTGAQGKSEAAAVPPTKRKPPACVHSFDAGISKPVSSECFRFPGEFIKNGEIAVALLRPVRVELQFLSAAVGGAIYDFCFCGLPSLLMFLLFVPVSPFCFAALPKVIAWLFGSFVFVFLLELTVGTLGYYTNNLWGLGVFKGTVVSFLSGELLPLHFYPAR